MRDQVLYAILLLLGNYYLTTFSIWFGHWISHVKWSPLRFCHVQGHHRLYPDAQTMRTEAFRFSSGKHDSNIALLPPLLLQTAIAYLCLPHWMFFIYLCETIFVAGLFAYIHIQFHLIESRLEHTHWFRKARRRHEIHHERDMNFMPADHFWDYVFGTYCQPELYPT